jgi:hypothetical protein
MESSSDILNWADQAVLTWTKSGIKLQAGLSLEVILGFEVQLDFRFPEDFRELYQKINGFKDFDWNKHMFSLWSLERIIKEYQKDDENNYVGFCDYLINSHSIGFFKSEEGIYKSYSQIEPIARTFREAIELINTNADLLY